ncbi:hypothetical protein KKE06_04635 [Candidatus Micrarchaeota archaeon]|nr:hypothetical protein [Candidatus Micrarchaeota archaeon]
MKIFSTTTPPARIFYEQKIIHALFPKNTPRVRAVRRIPDSQVVEIHMDEVKVHPALKAYQDMLIHSEEPKHHWGSREAKRNDGAVLRHHGKILEVEKEMRGAGIKANFENNANVSVANPKKPVFIEPQIVNILKLAKYLRKARLTPAKRAQIQRWLERLTNPTNKQR